MFSIIWYENNGCAAHYRTVINILLCNTCIINTLRGFVTRVPHAIMIIFSPMSMTFCDGILHDWPILFFLHCNWDLALANYQILLHFSLETVGWNRWQLYCNFCNHVKSSPECLSSPNRLYDWISKCRDWISYLRWSSSPCEHQKVSIFVDFICRSRKPLRRTIKKRSIICLHNVYASHTCHCCDKDLVP